MIQDMFLELVMLTYLQQRHKQQKANQILCKVFLLSVVPTIGLRSSKHLRICEKFNIIIYWFLNVYIKITSPYFEYVPDLMTSGGIHA
jgi:hypothetical protein